MLPRSAVKSFSGCTAAVKVLQTTEKSPCPDEFTFR